MTITAADEISTAASIPVAQLPIAPTPWNYQAESFQPGNSALQNSQFEHNGHTIYNQREIFVAAAERQDEGHYNEGQSQHHINGKLTVRKLAHQTNQLHQTIIYPIMFCRPIIF